MMISASSLWSGIDYAYDNIAKTWNILNDRSDGEEGLNNNTKGKEQKNQAIRFSRDAVNSNDKKIAKLSRHNTRSARERLIAEIVTKSELRCLDQNGVETASMAHNSPIKQSGMSKREQLIEKVILENKHHHLDENNNWAPYRCDTKHKKGDNSRQSNIFLASLAPTLEKFPNNEHSNSLFYGTSDRKGGKNSLSYHGELGDENNIEELQTEFITCHSASKDQLKNSVLRKREQEALIRHRKHFSFVAYGKHLTLVTIVLALLGFIFSMATIKSPSFFRLKKELKVSQQLDGVENIGLLRVELCYNQTVFHNQFWSAETNSSSLYPFPGEAIIIGDAQEEYKGCFLLKLSGQVINDKMWDLSLSLSYLALTLGSFSAIMLCLTICWESINLRPIAISMLLTYFLQSMSFAAFDSKLCKEHKCVMSQGSIWSIVASILWLLGGIACIRMDYLYQRKHKRLDRHRELAFRKLELQRKQSGGTIATASSEENKSVGFLGQYSSNSKMTLKENGNDFNVEEWKRTDGPLIDDTCYSV